MNKFKLNNVVQFTENHKWCGCFGYIEEIKEYDNDVRYMIGVPIPDSGTAFIFSMKSKNEFKYVGDSVLVPLRAEEE